MVQHRLTYPSVTFCQQWFDQDLKLSGQNCCKRQSFPQTMRFTNGFWQFLSADQAKVHTSNDSIELYAYLRESLDLETSNGYIKANIQLKNGKDVPPGLERSTGNL